MATSWNLNVRWIGIDEKPARERLTLDYRLNPRLTAGLEINGVGEVLSRATWFMSPPVRDQPSLVLGFSADRLSTPKGHAVFLTASKAVTGARFMPFGSIKYSTFDGGVAFPFGTNVLLGDEMTLQALYDGNYTHLLLTKSGKGMTVSAVLARMKHIGVAVSVGF